jgi:hypothetical protein
LDNAAFSAGSRRRRDKPGQRKETKMKIISFIARLRQRQPAQRRPIDPAMLTPRDWADLPVHHPRGN